MWRGIFLTVALILAGGCASTPEKPEPQISEHTAETIDAGRDLAGKFIDAFVSAVRQDDFGILEPLLPERATKRLDRSRFAEMQKWISEKLGRLTEVQYLGELRQGVSCDYIWKLTFEQAARTSAPQIDVAYLVRVANIDQKTEIVKVGFVFR